MALLKFGSIITDSRGSVGGHTLKWTHYGNTITKKPQTAKLLTPAQSTARARFQGLSKKWWQTLTPTQRGNWRVLAAANPRPNVWGDSFPLTGLAFFVGLNSRLMAAGELPTNDAPADQFVENLATVTLTVAVPSTASISFTPSPAPVDHVLYVRATKALSPGISAPSGRFVFLQVSPINETTPLDISSALLARFGQLLSFRQYFVEVSFLNISNGALSTPVRANALAT